MYSLFFASVLPLLIACTGSDSTPDTDTAVSVPEASPLWTIDDVEAQWAQLAAVGFPSPYRIRSEYLDFRALGDEDCPGTGTENLTDPPVSLNGCYSENGILFAGEFVWLDDEGEYSSEDGDWEYHHFGTQIADFIIESPDGTRMSGGGRLSVQKDWQDSGKIGADTMVTGTWSYSGSEYPWFASGLSSYLEIRVEGNSNKTDERIKKYGFGGSLYAINGTYGVPGVSVYFEGLTMGGGCKRWPSAGAVSVRSDDGTWYRIDYAGNEDCDSCGELIWDGYHSLGEACPDLLQLLPWFDPPLLEEM